MAARPRLAASSATTMQSPVFFGLPEELFDLVLLTSIVDGGSRRHALMLRVCRGWRARLLAQADVLWKLMCNKRFPRTPDLVNWAFRAGATSSSSAPNYHELYRSQLLVSPPLENFPLEIPYSRLTAEARARHRQYRFVLELRLDPELERKGLTWIGHAEDAIKDDILVYGVGSDVAYSMWHLRLFVVGPGGATVLLYNAPLIEHSSLPDISLHPELPMSTLLHTRHSMHDEFTEKWTFRPTYRTEYGMRLDLNLSMRIDGGHGARMTLPNLLYYLDHGLPWEHADPCLSVAMSRPGDGERRVTPDAEPLTFVRHSLSDYCFTIELYWATLDQDGRSNGKRSLHYTRTVPCTALTEADDGSGGIELVHACWEADGTVPSGWPSKEGLERGSEHWQWLHRYNTSKDRGHDLKIVVLVSRADGHMLKLYEAGLEMIVNEDGDPQPEWEDDGVGMFGVKILPQLPSLHARIEQSRTGVVDNNWRFSEDFSMDAELALSSRELTFTWHLQNGRHEDSEWAMTELQWLFYLDHFARWS